MSKQLKYFFCLLAISFSLFAFIPSLRAQVNPQVPEDLNGAEGIIQSVLKGFGGAFNDALSLIKSIYYKYINPLAKTTWQRVYAILGKEVERRKPAVQQEFNKEKREVREEIQEKAPSLWQRFKDLIY